jgi:hypothetical protein
MMGIIRSLIAIALAVLFAWVAGGAVRTGTYRTRSGERVDRRKRPIGFWSGVTICGLGSLFFFVVAWRITVGG